jgi:uroporphyrin-III C-methyltransferase/precorrin-2 dehydrogenase/sirohydrochlorin ferrochelatase/precorrin-2 dehydrogenase/sirohydrochlorin ferrochelatase
VPDPPEVARYYPVYLDLRDRLCVVVDGPGHGEAHGQAALWKAEGLVAGGARVRIVSERPSPELAAFVAEHPRVEHRARPYRPGDLAGAFLAISVTADPEVARPFWDEAEALGIPANVMDDVPRCSFIAPSILRRGDLAVAISTAGRAPALAVRLRERLERELGDHHARFLEIAGALRAPMLAHHPPFETRRELWYRLVDSDCLDLLAQGDEEAAVERVRQITGIDLMQVVS